FSTTLVWFALHNSTTFLKLQCYKLHKSKFMQLYITITYPLHILYKIIKYNYNIDTEYALALSTKNNLKVHHFHLN
ncbi:hypothetical protein ACJX0J_036755, partial [Zea mays]